MSQFTWILEQMRQNLDRLNQRYSSPALTSTTQLSKIKIYKYTSGAEAGLQVGPFHLMCIICVKGFWLQKSESSLCRWFCSLWLWNLLWTFSIKYFTFPQIKILKIKYYFNFFLHFINLLILIIVSLKILNLNNMSLYNLPISHNFLFLSLTSQTSNINYSTLSFQNLLSRLYTSFFLLFTFPPSSIILSLSSTFFAYYTPLSYHSFPIFNQTIKTIFLFS